MDKNPDQEWAGTRGGDSVSLVAGLLTNSLELFTDPTQDGLIEVITINGAEKQHP